MRTFAGLLERIGPVHPFDYPYMRAGKKRPDPLPHLIDAHRSALEVLRRAHDGPIVLAGKSMGGRVGCHLALTEEVAAVICFGYPLCGGGDPSKQRDRVLLALTTPALFIQGTRDKLCPLDLFETVRRRMTAPTDLHVVEGGDHSLLVAKAELKSRRATQEEVDRDIAVAIAGFIRRVVARAS
jgi:predicted alpha/beta-hydrolase family hydrolase